MQPMPAQRRMVIAPLVALGIWAGGGSARADSEAPGATSASSADDGDDDDDGDDSGQIEKGSFGLGLILGEPTGVSARLYLADDQAIQAAAGSAFVGGGLQIHADYVWHPWVLETRDSFALVAYLGPGVRVIQYDAGRSGDDYVALGLRVVGGIVFDFKDVPIDAFLEVAGVGEYAFGDANGGFGLALNAGGGARYYF